MLFERTGLTSTWTSWGSPSFQEYNTIFRLHPIASLVTTVGTPLPFPEGPGLEGAADSGV